MTMVDDDDDDGAGEWQFLIIYPFRAEVSQRVEWILSGS